MGSDLAGPGVTVDDVLAATASVCCGLEVIDSRYADFRFTLADVVADNASSARFVLGDHRLAPDFDLARETCVLERDGEVVDQGAPGPLPRGGVDRAVRRADQRRPDGRRRVGDRHLRPSRLVTLRGVA